jgi:hypothetical protein
MGFAPEMIARKAVLPHIGSSTAGDQHDHLFDIACTGGPRRNRSVGGPVMSAEIIGFIPRPDRKHKPEDRSMMVFRAAAQLDDLTMDHVDAAPCDYA